ncbi:hypothetical protein [Nocardia sp. CNY236]|uniref:hypothetical protein n=1 Tax=Nocardia sp. CNY236 TaxID=1169152 RepID=UPI00040AA608|nr:hypothetical protein [Nocardia sp. CNY236]
MTAALGALGWGSWALVVNWEAGWASATVSAVVQGTVSLCSISFLLLLANQVLGRPWRSPGIRVVAGTLVPYGVLLTVVVTAHMIAHTHNIFLTIAPSATIGIVYSAIYAYKNREKYAPEAGARGAVVGTDRATAPGLPSERGPKRRV